MRRPPTRHLAPLALALGACALAGCSSTRPALRVVDAQVTQQTEDAVVIDFILEGDNDTTHELPLREVRYGLSIDGQQVFRGARLAEATLRRLGSQRFALPVATTYDQIPGGFGTHEYRLSGEITYLAPGRLAEVFFDTGVRRPRVRFAATGELTILPPREAAEENSPADADAQPEG